MIRELEVTITGSATVGSQRRYSWSQVIPDSLTGAATTPLTAATGSTSVNYALERNNASVATGTRVTLRQYGNVEGQMVWVFDYTTASGSAGGDVFGPDHATTGALAIYTDPTGRFIGSAAGFTYEEDYNTFSGLPFRSVRTTLALFDSEAEGEGLGIDASVFTIPTSSISLRADSSSVNYDGNMIVAYGTDLGNDAHYLWHYFNGGTLVSFEEGFRFANNTANGFIYTEMVTVSGTPTVVRSHSSTDPDGMQYWMAHYASDGTAGTANGSTFKDGIKVGKEAAVADLSGGATLSDVITKVNDLLAKLRLAGIITP